MLEWTLDELVCELADEERDVDTDTVEVERTLEEDTETVLVADALPVLGGAAPAVSL